MSIIWQISKNPDTALECSKYDECSKYVQEHRLTLSFEVVTSVLGDHGDNPKHPYLICELFCQFCSIVFGLCLT